MWEGVRRANQLAAFGGCILVGVGCAGSPATSLDTANSVQDLPFRCARVWVDTVTWGVLPNCRGGEMVIDSTDPRLVMDPDPFTVCKPDYSEPEGLIVAGTISSASVCVADETLGDWCARELPCWDEPTCPNFLEFMRVIEWTGGVTDYEFNWNGQEAAIYSYANLGCTVDGGGTYDVLDWPTPDGSIRRAWFKAESGEMVGMSLHHPDPYYATAL